MKFYIIAGEASGDLHGSNLMKGIYRNCPDAEIRFRGGDMMAAVGGTKVRDYREGAVMGLSDVLRKAGRLLTDLRDCKRDIAAWKPDAVILIDYPGFNLKIARFAHKAGFRVFYYIAPKVWASREGRIRQIRRYVDRLFIIFPFEIPYFQARGVDFVYKGNPLVDAIDSSGAMKASREEFLRSSGLPDRPYLAFLAGSRKGEISRMMPVLMQLADRLHSLPQYRDWRFVVAGAPARDASDYEEYISGREYVALLFGRTREIVRHAAAAVVNSGTASLETVLLGTPQVVCWSTSPLTWFAATHILRVQKHISYVSLGNLCVNRPVFRELLQDDFNADTLESEVRRLVEDAAYRDEMLRGYAQIREVLGGSGASEAVAEAMISSLK